MARGSFIWADLSCLDPAQARRFYGDVFGWQFQGGMAMTAEGPIADTFEMPAKFRDIGMPPFWMSYIAVPDVAEAADIANRHNCKVELGPQDAGDGTLYALIRDPLGAGFSVYQSDDEVPVQTRHALFVSDAGAVQPFYSALFGWQFSDMGGGVHHIRAESDDKVIACLHDIPDPAMRGGFEYWGVLFASPDLDATVERIADAGGQVEAQTTLPEGPAISARDPDGAAFFVVHRPDQQRRWI